MNRYRGRGFLKASGWVTALMLTPGPLLAQKPESRLNQIPRLNGRFLWSQAVAFKRAGAEMVYVAMFDEVDEDTAIFKFTNDPPVGESRFLTYNGLPSDYYLWLTGKAGELFRNEIPVIETMPKKRD